MATADDARDEPDRETFTVTLSAAAGATVVDGEAAGEILDNDGPPSLDAVAASADEGDAVGFTVRLSAESERTVTVSVAAGIAAGDTASAGDFTAVPATVLTFAPGDIEKTVTVATTQDATDENDETFTLTLSGATNAGIGTATATGTIADDDPEPALSVADASATEGGSIAFTVRLSAASGRAVTVKYAISDGTATTASSAPGGADYTAASGRLTFAAGETDEAGDGDDAPGHDRRGRRDPDADAVEPLERVAAGRPDGDGDDNRQRQPAGAERGGPERHRGPGRRLRGDADGAERQGSDGGLRDVGRHGDDRDVCARRRGLFIEVGDADLRAGHQDDAGDGADGGRRDRRGRRDPDADAVGRANASLPADRTATGTIADNDNAPSLIVDEGSAD